MVFGNGGHAHVIASVIDVDTVFIVEQVTGPDQISQSDFFAGIEKFKKSPIYIGIGENSVRRKIFDMLQGAGVQPQNCISRLSFIARSAQLGIGVTILPGSVVGARATIHDNTIINTLSSVDHDCVLGEDSQVTAGVTFGGTVKTCKNCFFGIKSAIIPNKTIGDNVVVMAGSLVTQNIASNLLVGGVPARTVKAI